MTPEERALLLALADIANPGRTNVHDLAAKVREQAPCDVCGLPKTNHSSACPNSKFVRATPPQPAASVPCPTLEEMAEAVHNAYLVTCGRLGWDVKPENQVSYADLTEDSKELDRASVKAVLAMLALALPPRCTNPRCESWGCANP